MEIVVSRLLCGVLWWLETNVSETVLPPSSGLMLMVKEMYPLHFSLPRMLRDAQFPWQSGKPRLTFLRCGNLELHIRNLCG